MSDEPKTPSAGSDDLWGWRGWAAFYAFMTAFSAWCWSHSPLTACIGAIVGLGIAYLAHREAKAGRLD
ncbi:MAG TPA: hypothetical protein VGP76_05805 [Planctomycetaceae bacterium]|jgi:hypothetical protein|nr:hypothetical protein [Planctomycetaceae bacterium]